MTLAIPRESSPADHRLLAIEDELKRERRKSTLKTAFTGVAFVIGAGFAVYEGKALARDLITEAVEVEVAAVEQGVEQRLQDSFHLQLQGFEARAATEVDSAVDEQLDESIREVKGELEAQVERSTRSEVKAALDLAEPDIQKRVQEEVKRQSGRAIIEETRLAEPEIRRIAQEAGNEAFEATKKDLQIRVNSLAAELGEQVAGIFKQLDQTSSSLRGFSTRLDSVESKLMDNSAPALDAAEVLRAQRNWSGEAVIGGKRMKVSFSIDDLRSDKLQEGRWTFHNLPSMKFIMRGDFSGDDLGFTIRSNRSKNFQDVFGTTEKIFGAGGRLYLDQNGSYRIVGEFTNGGSRLGTYELVGR